MPIRLLALDLDGTLLDNQWRLSETNRFAVARAHTGGIEIVFVTGRRFGSARNMTSPFEFPHYLITSAGALVREAQGATLFEELLEPSLARRALEVLLPLAPLASLITNSIVSETPWAEWAQAETHAARFLRLSRGLIERSFEPGGLRHGILQIALMGTLNEMEAARAHAARQFGDRLQIARTEYPARDLELVDLTRPGADKGTALRKLASHLEVDRSEVMAIGDNHSDLGMLRWAGHPVVMGNASRELKLFGWPVTLTNDENGVAAVLDRL